MEKWKDCKHILCVRPDHMGDLLMSTPAIAALKETFGCKITVLTSSKAAAVAEMVPVIDHVIVFDLPWLKGNEQHEFVPILPLIEQLKAIAFDACVVFNVYSQNPVPSIWLGYLAEIPLRLAYCRENIYGLLTDWFPDPEPYRIIKHQVLRDLDLVGMIGATTDTQDIRVELVESDFSALLGRLEVPSSPYFVMHVGVSDPKRACPVTFWIELAQLLTHQYQLPIFLTGTIDESSILTQIQQAVGESCYNLAGALQIEELAQVIKNSVGFLTVNTGPMHLGAALKVPMVVLYADTNPQHTPWQARHRIFHFSIAELERSKNEVINEVNQRIYQIHRPLPAPAVVLTALADVLYEG